jgi:hypothetical protein
MESRLALAGADGCDPLRRQRICWCARRSRGRDASECREPCTDSAGALLAENGLLSAGGRGAHARRALGTSSIDAMDVDKVISPNPTSYGSFGGSVAIDGVTTVIGENVYNSSSKGKNTHTHILHLSIYICYFICVYRLLSIPCCYINRVSCFPVRLCAGAAHVFFYSDHEQTLTASDGAVKDYFGVAVSVYGDVIVATLGGYGPDLSAGGLYRRLC